MRPLCALAAAIGLAATSSPASASLRALAETSFFRIRNDGASTVTLVEVTGRGRGSPTVRAVDGLLKPGYVQPVSPRPAGECRFDIRISFESGESLDVADMDVCSLYMLVVTEAGVVAIPE